MKKIISIALIIVSLVSLRHPAWAQSPSVDPQVQLAAQIQSFQNNDKIAQSNLTMLQGNLTPLVSDEKKIEDDIADWKKKLKTARRANRQVDESVQDKNAIKDAELAIQDDKKKLKASREAIDQAQQKVDQAQAALDALHYDDVMKSYRQSYDTLITKLRADNAIEKKLHPDTPDFQINQTLSTLVSANVSANGTIHSNRTQVLTPHYTSDGTSTTNSIQTYSAAQAQKSLLRAGASSSQTQPMLAKSDPTQDLAVAALYCQKGLNNSGPLIQGTVEYQTAKDGTVIPLCNVNGVKISLSALMATASNDPTKNPAITQFLSRDKVSVNCEDPATVVLACNTAGGRMVDGTSLCQILKDDNTSFIDAKAFCEGPSKHAQIQAELSALPAAGIAKATTPSAVPNTTTISNKAAATTAAQNNNCKDKAATDLVKALLSGDANVTKNPLILSQLQHRAAILLMAKMDGDPKATTAKSLEEYANAYPEIKTAAAANFTKDITQLYQTWGLKDDQNKIAAINLANQNYDYRKQAGQNPYALRLSNQNASAIINELSKTEDPNDPTSLTAGDAATVWAIEKLRQDAENAGKSEYKIGGEQGNLMNLSTLMYHYKNKMRSDAGDTEKAEASILAAAKSLRSDQLKCLTENPDCTTAGILPGDQQKMITAVQEKIAQLTLAGNVSSTETKGNGTTETTTLTLDPTQTHYFRDGTVSLGLMPNAGPVPASVK